MRIDESCVWGSCCLVPWCVPYAKDSAFSRRGVLEAMLILCFAVLLTLREKAMLPIIEGASSADCEVLFEAALSVHRYSWEHLMVSFFEQVGWAVVTTTVASDRLATSFESNIHSVVGGTVFSWAKARCNGWVLWV